MSITESSSLFDDLENMNTGELLKNINQEDKKVATAVSKVIPQIEALVTGLVERMQQGGRLFYIGAGTSGRLGVLDASECPPTYGVPPNMVIGLIAGGDKALRSAVEFAEDDFEQAWKDLKEFKISSLDSVVGIAASGNTPYVIGGLRTAGNEGIFTGGITCNSNSEMTQVADVVIEAIVGPEFVTGSTRMKAGTAQKLVLNMITTTIMIRLGRIKGNKMIDMQISNNKLIKRAVKMISQELHINEEKSRELLMVHGNVRDAIASFNG